jgi:hypothetical protein
LEVLRNIVELGYKPVLISRVLDLFPIHFRGKVSRLLLVPKPFGFPEALDTTHPDGVNVVQSNWIWPEEQIAKAYKYALYERFFKEVRSLQTRLKELEVAGERPSRTLASGSLPPGHPLVIGLSKLIIKCSNVLIRMSSDDERVSAREEEILRLAFPPLSDVYTHGSLKHKRAHFRGHVLLGALSKLESGDLSLNSECEDTKSLLIVAWKTSQIRPGN